MTADSTAPTFVSAATSSDGAQVTLTYSENLDDIITAPTTAFNVSVDGSAASITQATTSGTDVRLGLAASILPGQSVSVSYTAPTDNAAPTNSAIQDTTGNDAASLSATAATNNSIVASNIALSFTSSTITVGNGTSLPEGIATADFDNDGLADLAVTDASTDSNPLVRIFLGNGAGGFTAGGTQMVGAGPTSITASDFNGDGKTDIATSNYDRKSISILLGDGIGYLATAPTLNAGPTIGAIIPNPRFIVSGDFNGDNKPDLAWTNDYSDGNGSVGIAINNGTGTPFSTVTPTGYAIGTNPYGLIATDLNGDGKLDLVAANSPTHGSGSISALLGIGDGTFQSALNTTVGTRPRYFAAGDFNRDGKQDLALTQTFADNNLRILLGDGSGGISSQATLAMGVEAAPRGVISADFNLDGYLDLAASSLVGDNVSIFLGSGDGNFSTRKVFAAGDASYWMASADFNRDGLPDLAITNASSTAATITLLLNRTTIQRSSGGSETASATKVEASRTPADNVPKGVTVQTIDTDGDGLREAMTDRDGRLIDGNRDGIADSEQKQVTGLRLIGDGALSSNYGAITTSNGVTLGDAECITPSDNGGFSVTTRDGGTVEASIPADITKQFIGVVSFELSGLAAGSTTTATIHLPSDLRRNPTAYIRFNYRTNRFEDYTDAQGNPLYALIDSNSDGQIDAIELRLTDGDLRWDRDGLANGRIEDPGAAADGERLVRGGPARDVLTGNLLANTLIGDRGRDILLGDLGNDILLGGLGNDRLWGGEGGDTSRGGPGCDRFLYNEASESSPSLPDRVIFGHNDRFDLRAMDANTNLDGQQSFRFIHNNAFSDQAGELRSNRSALQGDLNGDGLSDFTVKLLSGMRLHADNLLL